MAGTGWQAADLLSRFNAMAGRPTSGDSITDALKYQRLSDAQDAVILEIANIGGNALFGAPTQMTLASDSLTATFGTDGNGYALFPLSAKIFPTLAAYPNFQWRPGADYVDEGVQIRSLSGVPFAVAPYWQGITQPQAISSTVQSVIQPPQSRILVVIKAVLNLAEEERSDTGLAALMQVRWKDEWGRHSLAIRKHLRGLRMLGPLNSGFIAAQVGGRSGYVW